jgi:hypothetical protein
LSSNGIPKAIFPDLEEAQHDLEHLGFEVKHPMYAYRCPDGMGIHLTKQEPRANNYLGVVMQKKLAKTFREKKKFNKNSVEKRTEQPIKIVKSELPKNQDTIDKTKNEPQTRKFKCMSCGWKNNYDAKLKCALCNEFGPYENL